MIFDGQVIAQKFFSAENSSSYDTVVKYTTFGNDSLWKRQIVKNINKNHKNILDLACGTGILSSFIPSEDDIKIIGADLTFNYILNAKKRRKYSLLSNSVAEFLPFKSMSFDAIISSYLAKYMNIPLVVNELWRILKNGGIVIFHDFVYPLSKFMRSIWHYYFHILNQIGRIVKSWKPVFSDLDKVIKDSKWIKDLIETLENTGFKLVQCKYYTFTTAAIITAVKP